MRIKLDMEINKVRLLRARELAGSDHAAFANKIDRTPSQVSQIIGRKPTRNIGHQLARHIERCYRKPKGWLDSCLLGPGPPAVSARDPKVIHDIAERAKKLDKPSQRAVLEILDRMVENESSQK